MTIRELVTWLGFKIDDGTLNEYNRKVEAAKKKSSELSNAVSGVGKAVKLIGGAVAAAGIAALGKSILDTTGEVEQYRVTLGTMIGDQEKANKIIHDLDYSPVSDFYGTAAAIGGLQGMVTFGMQAEEASETLTRLGDIAQGNGEAFKSLSLNMGQVFAKGKADATDLKQFVGQGFDVVGEVAAMTGKSRAEIEKAGVSYEQCAAALKHITSEGGKYNGMLAKQSRTLPGLIKQFQSLSAAIKESIGTAVLDKVKDLMQYFLDLGRAVQDGIVRVGTRAFEAVLNAIADVIIAVEIMKIRMEKFGGAFTPIKALAEDVFGFLSDVIQSAIPYLMAVAQAILLAFKPIQAFVQPVLEALKPIFKDVFGFGAEQINALLPYINALTNPFQKIGEALADLLGKFRPIFRNLHDAIMAAFKPVEAFVMPILEALWGVAQMVFGAFGSLLDDTADATSGLAGIIESLTPIMSVLGNIIGGVITLLANGLSVILPALKPLVGIILAIVAAIKIWTAVQTVLNVVMAANPIGLIIIAVVALIGVVALLVKHWDAVKAALINGAKAVGNFFAGIGNTIKNAFVTAFSAIWNGIQNFFAKIKGFFAALPNWAKGMLLVLAAIIAPIPMLVIGALLLIRKHWDKIKAYIIKGATAIGNFFKKVWEAIKSVCLAVWNAIKDAALVVFEKIKAVWNGITDFFKGLWNALKESPLEAVQFIKNTFLGLFDGVKRQFFGFIDTIKGGWDKVKAALIKGAKAVGDFFKKVGAAIKNAFMSAWNSVKQAAQKTLDGIKSAWGAVKDFFANLWNGIIFVAANIWSGIVGVFSAVIERIKAVWNTITDFFAALWDGIVSLATSVWNSLVEVFTPVIERIKAVWNGITDFFKGLWSALKESPLEAVQFIKDTFLGLFDGVKRQFFGFIDTIKEGWDKVKGFFGGLWDGAVSFFTGGGTDSGAAEPRKVNDLILTPDGSYSTHPDDTIFAMKNPASLVDRLADFLAMSAPQPSYTLAGNSASQAVKQSVSNDYSRHSSSSVYNTPIHVTVNAGGMSAEQARRAVESGVRGALRDAISGSRGVIPSPEARRA